jgi:hypothetical protein
MQTNTATQGDPATYVRRRAECEKLTELARKLELIASRSEAFLVDPEFQALSVEYKAQFLEVHSLSTF